MKSVKIIKKQAIKAAELSFKNGNLDEPVSKKFIKAFKALPLNESIMTLNYYLQAIKREINKTTLTIESAVKLSKNQVSEIEKAVEKDFKVLSVTEQLSPSLLGGVKVRIGDVILDNSIKSRISQVKEALVS